MIVAMGNQNQIGLNGTMPWNLADDLKQFKQLTLGHPIIMGRKTFDSIGKALPGRLNIVVTSNPENINAFEVCPVSSLEKAIEKANLLQKDVFIIGGATLYQQALALADQMIISHVEYDGPADTFFPQINWQNWNMTEQKIFHQDSKNDHPFKIVLYTRNTK